jgi:hypothetical protein
MPKVYHYSQAIAKALYSPSPVTPTFTRKALRAKNGSSHTKAELPKVDGEGLTEGEADELGLIEAEGDTEAL